MFLQKPLSLIVNYKLNPVVFNISNILHNESLDVFGIHYFPWVARLWKVLCIMVLSSVEVILVLRVAYAVVAFYGEKNVENLNKVPTWHWDKLFLRLIPCDVNYIGFKAFDDRWFAHNLFFDLFSYIDFFNVLFVDLSFLRFLIVLKLGFALSW